MNVEALEDGQNGFVLTFVVSGAETLALPDSQPSGRADELWRTTCFELFWRAHDADDYVELNFSPSGRWAAYYFADYRSSMRAHPMAADPTVTTWTEDNDFFLRAKLDLSTLPSWPALVGLSAVVEEIDGPKSYWALAHPAGKPDFHDRACFRLTLPAAA